MNRKKFADITFEKSMELVKMIPEDGNAIREWLKIRKCAKELIPLLPSKPRRWEHYGDGGFYFLATFKSENLTKENGDYSFEKIIKRWRGDISYWSDRWCYSMCFTFIQGMYMLDSIYKMKKRAERWKEKEVNKV